MSKRGKGILVSETGGDGMKIAVEQYVVGFVCFVDKSEAYISDVDVENRRDVEALTRDIIWNQLIH